jgi:hypothetical protein
MKGGSSGCGLCPWSGSGKVGAYGIMSPRTEFTGEKRHPGQNSLVKNVTLDSILVKTSPRTEFTGEKRHPDRIHW